MKKLSPSSGDLTAKTEARLSKGIMAFYFAFLVLWIFLFRNLLPAVTDFFMAIYPGNVFNIHQFENGLIPLWNPLIGFGVPHAASWQSSCFYPLYWLWLFLGAPGSLVMMNVFHSFLSFTGSYLWLRGQKVSAPWSALGALSFAGSALSVMCWSYPHHMGALTWIPWIFWSAQKVLEGRSSRAWGGCIFFLSLQLLAGYPIFVFYTWTLLVFWALIQKPSGKGLLRLGSSLFLSLALSAFQWLPFVEYLTYAGRGGWWKEFPYFEKPAEYLALLNPGILGFPGVEHYRGSPANFVFNLYLGFIPFATFIAGWILIRKEKTFLFFWKISALVLLLWMAGPYFPLWKIIPEKELEWLEPSKADPLFIFCAMTYSASVLAKWFKGFKSGWTHYGVFLVSLLWLADLFSVPFQLIHRVPDPYGQEETIRAAEKMRQALGTGRFLSLSRPDQIIFSGKNPLEQSMRAPVGRFLADTNMAWGIPSASFYLSLWPKSFLNLTEYTYKGFPYEGDLLDVAGVRLFLLPQKLPNPKYRTLGKEGEDYWILNTRAAPEMRWVPGKSDFPDAFHLLNALAKPGNPWDKSVYLEKKADGTSPQLNPARHDPSPFLPSSACRKSLNFDCSQPGYLVFNQTFAPGWHAWMDGKPEPILRAYGFFMTVAVKGGGSHEVDFRYEPVSFRLGLFVSLVVFGFFLVSLAKNFSLLL